MADVDLGTGPDQLPGVPHPREQHALFGHEEAERAFLEGWAVGRLHHAWLVGGPQGIGKATLAYRIARFLLAGGERQAADSGTLAIPTGHPVSRQVAAQSHPDLAVVRRGLRKDGKGYSAEISVDDVRRGLHLFESGAGAGGYRVCIVDSADDLNLSSSNALLKLVEEPPPRSIFLIVSHAPQRVLATIRSRCRRLQLRVLDDASLRSAIRSLGPPWSGTDADRLDRAIALSDGSVRRAIEMLDEDTSALVAEVSAMLEALPKVDVKRVMALAESLSRRNAEDAYALTLDTAIRWVSQELAAQATAGPARLAPLVEVCEKVARAAAEVDEYNLDRRPLVLSMFAELAEAVRRTREAQPQPV
jgi:DNA polymerase III subunit delta'